MIVFLLLSLTVFSIYGAFLGAQRAGIFFTSTPMVVFWSLFLLLLLVGFFVYTSLRKHLSLMAIHAGCILVLGGGMIGSQKGHAMMNDLFGQQLFREGNITLHPGQSSDVVSLTSGTGIGQLPFTIRLEDASIEYYDQGAIRLHFRDGFMFDIPITVGQVFQIPDDRGSIEIKQAWRNFKMQQKDGKMVPYDSPEPGLNRAYELKFTTKTTSVKSFFVFEQFPMHTMEDWTIYGEYMQPRMVKDYKSTLQVIETGEVIKRMTIEVNKPLYHGGYHFYQNTFGYDHLGPASGIKVVSARGVWAVFAGYAIIFIGLVAQLSGKLRRNKV